MLDIGYQIFKSLLNQGLKKGKGHARVRLAWPLFQAHKGKGTT